MDIEGIRRKRESAVSIYTKFVKNRQFFDKKIFCFFEGEDRKYYGVRIEKYSNISQEDIIYYSCNGKQNVLRLYEMIESEYSNVKKMFFVDKDFDEITCKKELYVTPCYSIENHYVTERAFQKILHNEFGINDLDYDYKRCIEDFNKRKEEFNFQIRKLNSWIYYQKIKMKESGIVNVNYQNFKLNKIFQIQIDKTTIKKNITAKLLKEEYNEAYNISEEELEQYAERLYQEQNLRGKYQLWFLKMILEDMIDKNRNEKYFEYYRDNIKINPNINTLSSLSPYADTPEELKEFLKTYKTK